MSFKSLVTIPVRASKRKVRQRSALALEESPSTSFQRLDTEKGSFTEEQVVNKTQQIENKIAKKGEDEIRRTENTILKALTSLLEKSLCGNITSLGVKLTAEEGNTGLVQSKSRVPELDQENFDPENSYTVVQPNLYDIDIKLFFNEKLAGIPEKILVTVF